MLVLNPAIKIQTKRAITISSILNSNKNLESTLASTITIPTRKQNSEQENPALYLNNGLFLEHVLPIRIIPMLRQQPTQTL